MTPAWTPRPHEPLTKRFEGLLSNHSPHQLNRLFLVSLRGRYLYCPVSKVANSSIKAFLYEAELRAGGIPRKSNDFSTAMVHNLLFGPLLLPYQLPMETLHEALFGTRYRRILFTRNPYTRLVSCFLDRVRTPGSVPHRVIADALGVEEPGDIKFADFVAVVAEQPVKDMNPHWKPIYDEACCAVLGYDTVLKFEDMPDALDGLLAALYPKLAGSIDTGVNLSPAKTQASSRASDFITDDLKPVIARIYEKDFEAFGYDP